MNNSGQFYFINNQILPAEEASLLLSDLGLFRGYGVFDYFRTHGGVPFLMDLYLKRFRLSANQMRLSLDISDDQLAEVIRKLIKMNGRKESGVRLLLTGGYSENIFTPGYPNLIIRIEKSVLPEEKFYSEGIKLVSTVYMRDLPAVKTSNYLHAIRLWPEVEAAGATELLYSWKGNILECSRSNIFLVIDGRLYTPPVRQVLPGITRAKVLEISRQAGIPVEEKVLPLRLLNTCQEAFITGTTKRIMPVIQVNDQQIGKGKPGPVSRKLMEAWKKLEKTF